MKYIVDNDPTRTYSYAELKRNHPGVSFPRNPNQSTLEFLNAQAVYPTVRPEETLYTRVVEGQPEQSAQDGWWYETWVVEDKFPGYTKENGTVVTAEEHKAEFDAERLSKQREGMTCTPRQARLALNAQGLLSSVQAAIDSMEEPAKSQVQIEWEYATTVERTSPWISSMTVALGLTDEDMDNLFILARTL